MFSVGSRIYYRKERFTMSWKTTAGVVALTIALPGAARAAEQIPRPAVPAILEVGAGYKLFLKGHAIGTQNYICAPAATASGVDWLFIGPQATVFDAYTRQILTHYQSKNPFENDVLHATWQHSGDTSVVWAKKRFGSSDPNYVSPDAIEWLLLEMTGAQVGPTGGVKLSATTLIQRVNTVGGLKPPSADCTPATVNTRRLVSYEADYYFYQ
jgi:Protein of unknown function (DUF3455)